MLGYINTGKMLFTIFLKSVLVTDMPGGRH